MQLEIIPMHNIVKNNNNNNNNNNNTISLLGNSPEYNNKINKKKW